MKCLSKIGRLVILSCFSFLLRYFHTDNSKVFIFDFINTSNQNLQRKFIAMYIT